MTAKKHKTSSIPDTSFDSNVSSINTALSYIADDAQKLGLWFTSHLIEVAAHSSIAEGKKISDQDEIKPNQTCYRKQ